MTEPKFKVGDRVRRVGRSYNWSPYGHEFDVEGVLDDGDIRYTDMNGSRGVASQSDLELVWSAPPSSPIRTKTVKEIVWGRYGNGVHVSAPRSADTKSVVILIDGAMTGSELRDAAHIFIELADALDGK